MKMHVVSALCLWLSVTVLHVVRVWGQVDYSDKLFADYKVYELGSSVELHCNNTSLESMAKPNNTIPVSWMLNLPNNLDIINQTVGKYEMSDDKWTLTVHNTTRQDFGQYHCMLLDEEDGYYLVTVGLNVEGPYFEDLWKKYDSNVLIAFCALGGFLLLTAVVILLYIFRYQVADDDNDDDDSSSRSSGKAEQPVTASAAVAGVKSVPGYTPYNSSDVVKVTSATMKDDRESVSSDTSGHGSKTNVLEDHLQSSVENSDKQNETSSSTASIKSEHMGKDNKAFEAETEEKVKEEITLPGVDSSERSSLSRNSHGDDDRELTSM